MCELCAVAQPTTVYFDDQKFQQLSTPVDLTRADTLRVTCTRDATLRQKLPQLSEFPPRCVVWGDGSSDEMRAGQMMASATT